MVIRADIFLMINVLTVFAHNLDIPQGFDHSIYLDSEEKFRVFWKFDEESITFEVSTHCRYETHDLGMNTEISIL